MKKKTKHLILISAGMLFLLCCCFVLFALWGKWQSDFGYERKVAKVSLSANHESGLIIPVEIDGKIYPFLWDTGASTSCIDYKLARRLGYKGEILGHDTITGLYKMWTDTSFYGIIPVSIGDFKQKAHFRLDGYPSYFPLDGYDSTRFVGIIGQNIISRYHWLFDFEADKVKISEYRFRPGEAEDDVLKFNFTIPKGKSPIVNLCINESDTFPFVFDTGYTQLTINISTFIGKEDKMQPCFVFSDSLVNFISQDKIEIYVKGTVIGYFYDTLKINEKVISPISIFSTVKHLRPKENYIDLNFLLRYRQMYYNPREKEISFYVSPQDSAFVYQAKAEKAFLDRIKKEMLEKHKINF